MPLYAHSENASGDWHPLERHLQETARLGERFAAAFGAGELGRAAGLLHDLGKADPEFQAYLAGQNPRGPEHSGVGAAAALGRGYWEGLALVVAGHHGGLPAPETLKERLHRPGLEPRVARAVEFLNRVNPPAPPPPPSLSTPLELELFLRFLFSALVDADSLDTERHFHPDRTELRLREWDISALCRRLEEDQARRFGGCDLTPVNRARQEIYRACWEAAAGPQGIYRLTVPTGGGKTRSGLAFALRHAALWGKSRVIVALPYTSIIDQTAQVYREILGDDVVLEHHSAVTWEEDGDGDEWGRWRRLAAENWDAAVIVTTTVQLCESLLGHRPGVCRKLHHLANSVLILDEVQTLPPELLGPILDVLQQLVDRYRVTLVLSTATQPALASASSPYLTGLKKEIREMVPDPGRYFQELKRVSYDLPPDPWPWERAAAVMLQAPQSLAIVNTKADALALLAALGEAEALHLSTRLCPAHRREVLREIRARLAAGRPCRVVATQVVEAGVDLDFPLVLRALGPLDRIVQAAGRCNREGRLSPEEAQVIIFRPATGGTPPGAYRTGTEVAAALLKTGADLHDPQLYDLYFRQLYRGVNLDKNNINSLRSALHYPEVAARFRLIEEDTVPLVVRWPRGHSPVDELLAALRAPTSLSPRLAYRRLHPYLVTVRRRLLPEYQRRGLVQEVFPGLWEWQGGYDEVLGLMETGRDPEDLVI